MTDTTQQLPEPQWVMFGWQQEDWFFIIASRSLTITELKARSAYRPPVDCRLGPFDQTPPTYEVLARMDDFVLVQDASYDACMRRLFEHWRPGNSRGTGAGQIDSDKKLLANT